VSTLWMNVRVVMRTTDGWRYLSDFAAIGPRQRLILGALARACYSGKVERGAPTRIADSLGVARCTIWTQIRELKRKFGVRTLTELAQISKQLNIKGRGGPGNRASMFAPVTDACKCRRATAPRTEALHPGPHASRVL
jgi:biotin operon repressor